MVDLGYWEKKEGCAHLKTVHMTVHDGREEVVHKLCVCDSSNCCGWRLQCALSCVGGALCIVITQIK